jgi:hypothetical protein
LGQIPVGHYLTTKALVFEGNVLTSTDIVVASKREKIGAVKSVTEVPRDMIDGARRGINEILQRAVEDMKVSAAPVTVQSLFC